MVIKLARFKVDITGINTNSIKVLTKEEYVNITVKQLTYLRKEIVIHRITGDPKKEDLIEPTWLLKKFEVLNEIDKNRVKEETTIKRTFLSIYNPTFSILFTLYDRFFSVASKKSNSFWN